MTNEQNFANDLQNFLQQGSELEYIQVDLRHEVAVQIERQMKEAGMNRKELAKRVSASQAYITKALSGDANLTLDTMAKLAYGLGARVHLRIYKAHDRPSWYAERRKSTGHVEVKSITGSRQRFRGRATHNGQWQQAVA